MPTAIVTGASRGLGKAVAAGLAAGGWTVVTDGRTLIDDATPGIVPIRGDVTDPEHRKALVGAAPAVDLLVNNAGILGPSPQPPLADYPLWTLREVYEVNVFAPLALTQLALPALRVAGGTVVNVTSDAAVEAYEGWGGYGSAKAAVEQVSRALSAEEPAIRVYWADPGDLRTTMHQEAFPGEDISDRPLHDAVVPAVLRLIRDRPPSGRVRLQATSLEAA